MNDGSSSSFEGSVRVSERVSSVAMQANAWVTGVAAASGHQHHCCSCRIGGSNSGGDGSVSSYSVRGGRENLLIVMHFFIQKSTSKIQTVGLCRLANPPRDEISHGGIVTSLEP